MAAPFVVGGINSLRAPDRLAGKAADVGQPVAEAIGLPSDPVLLVKLNAGVQIGAGLLLASGRLPRVASLLLGASLVPTTLAGHRFWEEREPGARAAQLIQFSKNAGMLGGLLVTALDTGGRPSVFWSGRRAADRAARSIADTVSTGLHSLPGRD